MRMVLEYVSSVTELIDLEVEKADRTPERGVVTIALDHLLIGFVGLVVLM